MVSAPAKRFACIPRLSLELLLVDLGSIRYLSPHIMHLASKNPHFLGCVGSAPQRARLDPCSSDSRIIDGQFDDATSELPAFNRREDSSQSSRNDTTVPMVLAVTPPLNAQPSTAPTWFLIPASSGTTPENLSRFGGLIQGQPSYAGSLSNVTSIPTDETYVPIAPRPLKPPQWRSLPVSTTKNTKSMASKKAVPVRRSVSSKGPNGTITAYGTKLVAALRDSSNASPFCRILKKHPNDILIPRTDVYPTDRLPMLRFVERDEKHPIALAEMRREDVLLGRGGLSNRQCGNLCFRALVAAYREAYHALPKGGKGQLARYLCNYVRLSGGRFLELRGALWYECGDDRAQAKCSQALRETIVISVSDCEETSLSTGESADGSVDSL